MDILLRIKELIKRRDKWVIRVSAMDGAWHLGFTADDIIQCSLSLSKSEYVGKRRLQPQAEAKETGYVFKTVWMNQHLYIKYKILEGRVYVLSFKESTDL